MAKKVTKRKKGGGGTLRRTETIAVRLDSRLRFGAEIAAKKHRRTLSSFVEWAVERAIKETSVGDKGESAYEVMQKDWHYREAVRFQKYAKRCRQLLTPEEEIKIEAFEKLRNKWGYIDSYNQERCSELYSSKSWDSVCDDIYKDVELFASEKISEEELYKRTRDKLPPSPRAEEIEEWEKEESERWQKIHEEEEGK